MILMGVHCNVVRDWSRWPSNTIQTSLQVPTTPSGDFCNIIVNTDKFLYAIDDLDLDETMHWSLNIRIDQTSNPRTDVMIVMAKELTQKYFVALDVYPEHHFISKRLHRPVVSSIS